MWHYQNPVDIHFGPGCLIRLPTLLNDRSYALVTYDTTFFSELAEKVIDIAGQPFAVINKIEPNPDIAGLEVLCEQLSPQNQLPGVIVALGGGSVIDTAKFLAAAGNDFMQAKQFLMTGEGVNDLNCLPVIAIPTTAGTGSEVTCWATVWDKQNQKKYSLSDTRLYPESALCDPNLTLGIPAELTLSTGLDALSHALESIWNKNRNPVSSALATESARSILYVLPALIRQPDSVPHRSKMMEASIKAGLAFSNTKTSIAHNISYAITLQFGTPHGIACSFTLPKIMSAVIGQDEGVDADLRSIFGDDLSRACKEFNQWFRKLGVQTSPVERGYNIKDWQQLLLDALNGQRGKNFIGEHSRLLACYES